MGQITQVTPGIVVRQQPIRPPLLVANQSIDLGMLTPALQEEVSPAPPYAIPVSNIDWSQGTVFTQTLTTSRIYTFSNITLGQIISVRLTNTGAFTVAWPGSVLWPGGTPPTMTVGAHSDIYTFLSDGVNIYGTAVQNY